MLASLAVSGCARQSRAFFFFFFVLFLFFRRPSSRGSVLSGAGLSQEHGSAAAGSAAIATGCALA